MRTVLAAVLCVACGPVPKSPTLPAPITKTYAPFTSKLDAKAPNHAVILGTDDKGGATLLALPGVPAQITVGAYRIAVGGDGTPSRAAIVAAEALGKDPSDIAVAVTPEPPVEASAQAAAGIVAALTGAPVDPAVTIAGVIDPDGTIAPAPGGAAPVATLADAYKLLTKHALPVAVPVPEADMALDAETATALETKYREWQQKLASEWALLFQLDQSGQLPETLKLLATTAKQRGEDGERLEREGKLPAAYGRMLVAWVYAKTANQTYAILAKIQDGDVSGAIEVLAALDPAAATGEAMHRIAALQPTTIGGHMMMVGAFQAALRGWSFAGFASAAIGEATQYLHTLDGRSKAELGGAPIAAEVVKSVAPVALLVGRATAELTVAQQELDFEVDHSAAYTAAVPAVARAATAYHAAAVAGLEHVEHVKQVADDTARTALALGDPDYLVAYALLHGGGDLGTAMAPLPQALLALAAGELAYQETCVLGLKYESLGVQIGATGKILAIASPPAFAALVAASERIARANARAARVATGAIPVQAKLAYQLATVERGGDLDDQVNALAELWTASAFGQTAALFARD